MTDHLDEPHEMHEVRLIQEGADCARRLGESARAAVAAVRLLEDAAATLVLRQAAFDYFERTQAGRVSGLINVRDALNATLAGRLQHLLAPYVDEVDPGSAEDAEAALWELGEDDRESV